MTGLCTALGGVVLGSAGQWERGQTVGRQLGEFARVDQQLRKRNRVGRVTRPGASQSQGEGARSGKGVGWSRTREGEAQGQSRGSVRKE